MTTRYPPTPAHPTPTAPARAARADGFARPPSRGRAAGAGLLMLLLLGLLVALAAAPFIPASVVPANGLPTVFSAERAQPHLQAIAAQPHPTGSVANARVRDYLVAQLTALGLQPQVQRTIGLRPDQGSIASIENVLVRLPGTASSRAVLIVGHYDSVMGAPGAGDNGVAVAAMLETLRALHAGPPLRNDLIFLFDDGEEPGLFGAHAFATEHAWARDVGVAFDFDADAPLGPTILLWTTPNDGWLVGEIARAVPTVMAYSIDIPARRQRWNNDLHPLMAAGMTGAHFNTVAGSTVYHSPHDSLATLDPRSLQDRGNVMLALARHFGNLPIGTTTASDTTFFALYGRTILSYPVAWALPLALLAGLGAGLVSLLGWWRGRLSGRRFGQALIVVPLGALSAALVAHLGWQVMLAAHPEARVFAEQDFYGRGLAMGALYALTMALGLALWPGLDRRLGAINLAGSTLIWTAALAIFQGMTAPHASLPTTVAALGSAIGLAGLSLVPAGTGHRWSWSGLRAAALLLAAVAPIGAIVPLLVAVSLDGLAAGPAQPIAVLVLLLGLLAPQLVLVARLGRRWLPAMATLVGLSLLLAAQWNAGPDVAHPRHESLLYIANPAAGIAYWASADPAPGAWTSQILGTDAFQRPIGELIGAGGDERLLASRAPLAPLPAPALAVLGQTRQGDEWTLRLRLSSPRGATRAFLLPGAGVHLLAAGVADQPLQQLSRTELRIDGLPAAGLELTLRLQASGPVELVLVDVTAGLPTLPGSAVPARPATTLPLPGPEWLQADPTLVVGALRLTT